MARIPKVQTADRNINQLQSNILGVVQPIANNAMVNGVFITTPATTSAPATTLLSLVSGANVIPHGLGRTPLGWFLVRQSGAVDLYETALTPALPAALTSAFLYLTASAAVTASIYVF